MQAGTCRQDPAILLSQSSPVFQSLEVGEPSSRLLSMVLSWWRVLPIRAPPKVSFLLSSTNRAVAATARTHSGYSLETGSRSLEMRATGCFSAPLSLS